MHIFTPKEPETPFDPLDARLLDDAEPRQRRTTLVLTLSVLVVLLVVLAAVGLAMDRQSASLPTSAALLVEASDLDEQRRHEAAVPVLQRLLQHDGRNMDARWLLGRQYLALGNGGAAQKQLELAQRFGAWGPALENALVRAKLLRGEFEEVILEILSREVVDPEGLVLLAKAGFAIGRDEDAVTALKQALAAEPDNAEARRTVAVIEFSRGAFAAADLALSPLLAQPEPDMEALLIKGNLDLAQARYPAAEQSFRQVLQQVPSEARATLGLTMALLGQRKPDEALTQVEPLLERHPDSANINYLGALTAMLRADREGAVLLLRNGLASEPQHAESLLLLAMVNLADGEVVTAEDLVLRAVKSKPSSRGQARRLLAEIAPDLGLARRPSERIWDLIDQALGVSEGTSVPAQLVVEEHLRRGQVEEARLLGERLVKAAPDNPDYRFAYGRALLAAGDVMSARNVLAEVVVEQPDLADAHYLLGVACMRQGHRVSAEQALMTALELDASHLLAKLALGQIALEDGRLDEASAIAQRVQAEHPLEARGFILHGDAHMAAGQAQRALDTYQAAFEQDPSRDIVLRLYHASRSAGDSEGAASLMDRWLNENPQDWRVLLTLGAVAQQEGRIEDAVGAYERVVAAQPEQKDALNNLAWVYFEQGNPRALEYAQRAYELAPNDARVIDTYGWLLANSNRGDVHRAADLLERATNLAPAIGSHRFHWAVVLAKLGRARPAVRELKSLAESREEFPERERAAKLLTMLDGGLSEALIRESMREQGASTSSGPTASAALHGVPTESRGIGGRRSF